MYNNTMVSELYTIYTCIWCMYNNIVVGYVVGTHVIRLILNVLCTCYMLRLEWNWVISGNVPENVFTIWPRGKARLKLICIMK